MKDLSQHVTALRAIAAMMLASPDLNMKLQAGSVEWVAGEFEGAQREAHKDTERLDWVEKNARGCFNFGNNVSNTSPFSRWGIDKCMEYEHTA